MPTKRELRIAEQAKVKETFVLDDAKMSGNKRYLWAGLGSLVLAGLVVFFVKAGQPTPFNVAGVCLSAESFHIHPHLSITVNGENQVIPKGVGVASPTCIRPLHTHETDGVLHVEFEYKRDFTLAEFFQVWGKTFTKDQILDFKKDATHDLTLTVDGLPTQDFENLILKDQQKIVINYSTKTK